eukprot:Blabericola_migrator_1__11414@NODE_677_length_6914_cov_138_051994_g491_i0_p2_GENE_NODE_677_length_6914_cov_138_051994_g491_i0NODE_677_length_6914_cov_138_051994_g491_i0_p2_ORF_typecomplete_len477_score67_86Helicase_C/PF00271_31/9_5Helicase_C/PF00271_31/7_3e30DEAD/PF00270_29/1_9e25DEAD/PF00270_29/1_7e02ResIII/PF04851_15/1_1e12ResIII/PF04851_15/6e03ResIII/PF04851_15/67ERCC3_RAD25_C/PF16203_5/1_5e08UTP25/PF06862_12/6_3e02UTP25/PF06862_12/0_0061AAA_22/PF13401_6/1_1e03AAA_22/PF13401_6/0_93AAA_22/PF13
MLVPEDFQQVLKEKFGIERLYNFQEEVLSYMLKSFRSLAPVQDMVTNDLCVYVPTGYGKTLAYVLPTLLLFREQPQRMSLPGVQALILVPTRELVKQVFHVFKMFIEALELNISIVQLTGDLKIEKERALLQGIATRRQLNKFSCGPKPGRWGPSILVALASHITPHCQPFASLNSFDVSFLRLLIVDEADRLLDTSFDDWLFTVKELCERKDLWRGAGSKAVSSSRSLLHNLPGKFNFGSAQLKLDDLPQWWEDNFNALAPSPLHKIALTATNVQNFKGFGLLRMKDPIQIVGELTEEETAKLSHHFIRERSAAVVAELVELQRAKHKERQCLVFCNKDSTCKSLCQELRELRVDCRVLSANLDPTERHQALKAFREGKLGCLICTDLAARGLDIDTIYAVIHYDLPQSPETYIHRVGRAGRAGNKGRSIAMAKRGDDIKKLQEVIHKAQKHRRCELKPYFKLIKKRTQGRNSSP